MSTTTKISFYVLFLFCVVLQHTAQSQVIVTSTGGTTSGSYATLNAFFTAVNAGTHTGVIGASITSNISEGVAFTPVALNASGQGSASYSRINISTTGAFTVSGSPIVNRSLLELNGADNVTIDGNLGGVQSLTFENNAATTITATAVIRLIGATTGGLGCSNDTIRGCIIIGNGDMAGTTAATQFGIYAGGTANPVTTGTGDLHANIVVHNNLVMRAIVGIHVAGTTAVGNAANNITITNNTIGSHSTALYVRWRGIAIGNAINSLVSGNTIFNIRSSIGSSSSGIELFGTASNNVTVSRNEVNRVYNTSVSGFASNGININGGSNHLVINNIVWDVLGINYLTFSTFIASGIRLSLGTGHRVLYNSVHLYSNTTVSGTTAPTNPISAAFFVSSTAVTGLTIRNNIFSNKMTSTVTGFRAFAALFAVNYNMTTAGNTFNNNAYMVPGAPTATTSYFVGGLNSAATLHGTLASWRTITAGDLNSIPLANGVAPFTNDSTLSIPSLTATEIESGGAILTGTGISSPNIDYTLANRPAFGGTAPDIGALEFAGIPVDFTPPQLSYSPLANTSSFANRSLVATITDVSLIDTAINAPRIYFKKTTDANVFGANNSSFSGWKYVSTADTSSPFTFTIDNSLLLGGVVNVDDTIQYFVIAQDRSGNANTATLPSTGFGGGRVDSFFTAPNPNFYVISPPPLAGTYTVGTGGDYPTLTAAVNNLNLRGVSSSVVFRLTDTLYSGSEVFPIQFNDNIVGLSGVRTVTIRPDTLVNARISGSSTLGLIKLNGADNIIIDGSNSNTTSRNLTINNTNALTTAAVIWLASANATNGASNNSIRNCIIRGASLTTTYAGVFIGGTATIAQTGTALAANNANSIVNNDIQTVQFGILNLGTSTAIDSGIVVTDNLLGSSASGLNGGGIALYFSRFATVTRNTIRNVIGTGSLTGISGSAALLFGIYIRNNQNSIIRYNTVHTISGTSSQRIHGIITESPNYALITNPSNNVFSDNVLYHIHNTSTGNTSWSVTGLGVYGGYGDRILFNSVQMSSPTGGNVNAAAGPFAAFSNGNAVQTVNSPIIEIRNNVFIVTGSSVAGATPYTHYTNLTSYTTGFVNNNFYFQNSTGTTAAHMGFFNALARTTFADWQLVTTKDTNSVAGNPLVSSLANLRPQLGSPLINAGSPVAGFTLDILNAARSATNPTVGAFEQGVDVNAPTITYTPITNQSSTSNLVLAGFAAITDVSGVASGGANSPTLYYKRRSDANAFAGNTAADNGWKYVQSTNTNSPFSFTVNYALLFGGSVNIGDTIQYFVVAQDSILPANIGSIPAAGFSATDVLTINTAPTTPNSYIITQPPLAGIYTIGTAGDFTTIAAAAGELNLRGVSAPVTFTFIDTLYTLTSPVEILTYPGMVAANPVTFRPSTTNTVRITANIADVLFRLMGTAFVNFVGFDSLSLPSNSLMIENTNTGGNTIALRNDASNNSIRYCRISGANTIATGGIIVINTSITRGNNNNIIENNFIHPVVPTTAPHNAIYITANLGVPNSGNIIRNNYIFNYTNRGVFVTTNNNNTTITGNHFYQTINRTMGVAHSAIWIDNANGTNMVITNNYIGGSDSLCGGSSPMNITGTQLVQLLYFSASTNSMHQITGNRFANMVLTTTNTGANHGLIFLVNGRINCSGNQFGYDTSTSSINVVFNGSSQSNFYVIGAGGTLTPTFDTVSINNNFMGGITATGTGTGISLRCIDYAGSTGFFTFENNTIGSPVTPNSISQNTPNSIFGIINRNSSASFMQRFIGNRITNLTSNTGILMGMQIPGATPAIISNNTVSYLTSNSTTQTGVGASAAVVGILSNASTTGSRMIENNLVYNLSTTATSAIANIGGIVCSNSGTSRNTIMRNRVHSLHANSTAACLITGIHQLGGNIAIHNNYVSLGMDSSGNSRTEQHGFVGIEKQTGNTTIVYNTVWISGAGVTNTGNVNTSAFSRTITGLDSLMNNIFINERSNISLTGGSHYAIRVNDSTTLLSRRNLLYASGISGMLGLSGITPYSTLSAWNMGTTLDTLSTSKAVTFVSFNDLHLAGSSIGDLDLIATPLAAYPNDMDNDPRSPFTPYMGCDENIAIPLPVKLISFTANVESTDVLVRWTTASEQNNQGFEIERSVDGKLFEQVGFVKGAGNSNQTISYSLLDNEAFAKTNANILYYRLKQVDVDGNESYSNIVMVSSNTENTNGLSVYPNPFTTDYAISLTATTDAKAIVELFNVQGKQVHVQTKEITKGFNVIQVTNVEALQNGIYFVKVTVNGETQVMKLVKN